MVSTSTKNFSVVSTMNTLITILAFAVLAVLVYKLWKPMLPKPKKQVMKQEANLYFFYTNWCGHSQKAMPEWEQLENVIYDANTFGDVKVKPIRVDCEEDRETAELYEVDAYPTIKLETSQGIYEYNKRPTKDGLLRFLRQSLGPESRQA